jgi:hypothetical protein
MKKKNNQRREDEEGRREGEGIGREFEEEVKEGMREERGGRDREEKTRRKNSR